MRVTRCDPRFRTGSDNRLTIYFQYHFSHQEVVTVWSAPNYCYRCGNVASIMRLEEDLKPNFKVFNAVPDDKRSVPPGRGGRGEYFL